MQKAIICWRKRQASRLQGKEFRGSNEYLMKNGSELLEERISLFHGKTNPIRCFSAAELNAIKLDRNSAQMTMCDGFKWYNGILDDGRKVLIRGIYGNYHSARYYIREIAVSVEMSSHNNVHKLLGCCLETKYPVLVFEWLENVESLADRIFTENKIKINQQGRLEWKNRLRIAWEISHAVSYLHSAFPRPIIHRDIKPSNVLLDQQHNIAKLSGFDLSVSIPEGEEYVEVNRIVGTFGYLAPEYRFHGRVDEKVDVFSFGVLLLELLTGRKPLDIQGEPSLAEWAWERKASIENKEEEVINEMVDPAIATNATSTTKEDLMHQLQASFELALMCTAKEGELRPTMVEVATQLKRMVDQAL